MIHPEMKMADLLLLDIQLLAVIQRLEIPLGFREKTIREVCLEHQVDIDFFTQLANMFHDPEYFSQEDFMRFKSEYMVRYLHQSHQGYLQYRIPEIESQILDLEDNLNDHVNSKLLLDFFREYIREFNAHIELEEKYVFPYSLAIEDCIVNNRVSDGFMDQFKGYRIEQYIEAHNDIEEKLFDLKNILIKYMPPPTNNCKYNNLIFELFRLESDLKDHALLENRVLIPKVKMMEKKLEKLLKDSQS